MTPGDATSAEGPGHRAGPAVLPPETPVRMGRPPAVRLLCLALCSVSLVPPPAAGLLVQAPGQADRTGPQAPLPRLEPLAVVGCAACEGPEAFGRIEGLALLRDGTLVIVDGQEPMVRLFDPEGRASGAFGRVGDGPGELRTPAGVATTADGRIVVADIRRGALTVFDRQGRVAGSVPVDAMVTNLRGGPGGRWIAFQEAHWATMSAGVRLLSADLEPAGTPLADTEGVLLDAEGRPAAVGLFSSAPDPGGRVAVAEGSTYRILILGPDGESVGEVRRDVPRVPRTPEEIEALRADHLAAARLRGAENPEGVGSPPEVDPLHPHFYLDALAWDGEGRLWVRTPRGGPTATVFDVFHGDGSWLGEVRVPVALDRHAVGHGVLAGRSRDPDTGVQRVHRWALREGG